MSYQILDGDCRAMLSTLPERSSQLVVTSPPYHGLRAYGTSPQTWPSGWVGELGSEPTVEQFVANLVSVFAAVRRVLRDDGVCIVNLGDSYAGSGKGPSNSIQRPCSSLNNRRLAAGAYPTEWIPAAASRGQRMGSEHGESGHTSGVTTLGLPAKNLMGVPWRFALAMQADGWVWRSWLPWVKRSAMPESCTDRPTNALEVILMFSKSQRYFWDGAAVRQAHADFERGVNGQHVKLVDQRPEEGVRNRTLNEIDRNGNKREYNPLGRAYRNSDPFFAMLDQDIADLQQRLTELRLLRASGGLHTDEDGLPIALDVNPQATSLAHFASFPERLVEPFVKAGTSERGQCAQCGKAWVRVVSKAFQAQPGARPAGRLKGLADENDWGGFPRGAVSVNTLGWHPQCSHDAPSVPQAVLDPFVGTGTVLLVSERLGRDSIGIELSATYGQMARERLAADAPLVDVIAAREPAQLSMLEAAP